MVMIFGDQFAMEAGRSRKLETEWRGPFGVIEFDNHTQNYTVSMDSRIYRCQRGGFHSFFVKPYHPKGDQRVHGRAYTEPVPILIDDENEWEVETILTLEQGMVVDNSW